MNARVPSTLPARTPGSGSSLRRSVAPAGAASTSTENSAIASSRAMPGGRDRGPVYSSGPSGSLAPLPRYATAALLALIVALGFGWRAHHAASPYLALQSRDELAYVTLGQRLATRGIYEGGEDWPLRWPPGAPAFFAVAYKLDHSSAHAAPKPDIPSAYWLQA